MQYDLKAARWKIARYIQTLPPGVNAHLLEITLPQGAPKPNSSGTN
jgi:hypothetical protein